MGNLNKTTSQVQDILDGKSQLLLNTQDKNLSEISVTRTDIIAVDASANTGNDLEFAHTYEAFKFTATETTNTIRSIAIYVKKSGTITNVTDVLSFWVYTDNAGVPGTKIGNIEEYIRYGSLTDSYVEHPNQTGTVNIVSGNSYWIVIKRTAAPAGGSVYLDTAASGTAMYAYSSDETSWTTGNGVTGRFKLFKGQPSIINLSGRNYPSIDVYCETEYGIRAISKYDLAGLFVGDQFGAISASSRWGIGLTSISEENTGVYGISINRMGVHGKSNNLYGVYGEVTSASGNAVYGNTILGVGVRAKSISGYGLSASSESNYGVYAYSKTKSAGMFYRSNTNTNTIDACITTLKYAPNAVSGIGTSIEFRCYNVNSIEKVTGVVGSTFLDLTVGAEKSNLIFQTNNLGTVATRLTINPDGSQVQTQFAGALTDGAPTASEIEAITGVNAATAGAGYKTTIKDNAGTGLVYLIRSDGTDYYYLALTKAL